MLKRFLYVLSEWRKTMTNFGAQDQDAAGFSIFIVKLMQIIMIIMMNKWIRYGCSVWSQFVYCGVSFKSSVLSTSIEVTTRRYKIYNKN